MNNPSQDGWDWPYILYVGRKWLGYTDDQIWSLTPRQFDSQLKVHQDVSKRLYGGGSTSTPLPALGGAGFIDQIPGW
jgi:hypothetical protein